MFKAYTDTYRGYCGSSYCTGTVTCRTRDTYAHILLFLEKYTLMHTASAPSNYKITHQPPHSLFQGSSRLDPPNLASVSLGVKHRPAHPVELTETVKILRQLEKSKTGRNLRAIYNPYRQLVGVYFNCWATDKVWGYMGLHGVTCFSKSGVWIDACCSLGFLAAASAGRPDVQYHTGRRSRKSRVKSNWQQFFKKNDSIIPQKSPLSQNSWKYGFGVS
ncbi:hypothetical protein B0I73DRAFT_170788 [Yarrowia lipolytica]|uniref:Uncharacterized protein n=1 Tax=Yarrowia lipolytica TaxID=4952 RepID=A0A371C3M7_YARLL|nr:hypothetical protein B0I71DRAFT_165769 [Yarrowia lipolytica]RDW37720.1 hypothetical protein B0I73DRAFT_170788 [Yarrowia lipolytica]RDW55765.1 hypothetical protein B0I75DRAFT_155778 [Yarrowia lipolytica]